MTIEVYSQTYNLNKAYDEAVLQWWINEDHPRDTDSMTITHIDTRFAFEEGDKYIAYRFEVS